MDGAADLQARPVAEQTSTGSAAKAQQSAGKQSAGRRPPWLGLAAFGLILILGANLCLMGYRIGDTSGISMAAYQTANPTAVYNVLPPSVETQIGHAIIPTIPIGVLGLAAWISAIVAIATRRGRGWGIAGMLVGLVVPLAAGAMFMIAWAINVAAH
jgi:hypothetical protein